MPRIGKFIKPDNRLDQGVGKRKTKKNPKLAEEIIKIRSGINEKEMKEMIAKINKIKSWFS